MGIAFREWCPLGSFMRRVLRGNILQPILNTANVEFGTLVTTTNLPTTPYPNELAFLKGYDVTGFCVWRLLDTTANKTFCQSASGFYVVTSSLYHWFNARMYQAELIFWSQTTMTKKNRDNSKCKLRSPAGIKKDRPMPIRDFAMQPQLGSRSFSGRQFLHNHTTTCCINATEMVAF